MDHALRQVAGPIALEEIEFGRNFLGETWGDLVGASARSLEQIRPMRRAKAHWGE